MKRPDDSGGDNESKCWVLDDQVNQRRWQMPYQKCFRRSASSVMRHRTVAMCIGGETGEILQRASGKGSSWTSLRCLAGHAAENCGDSRPLELGPEWPKLSLGWPPQAVRRHSMGPAAPARCTACASKPH